MAPTRWAICGAGKVSNDFVHALKSMPESDHKIVSVAASSKDRADNFAKEFGIPKSFGSYEELNEQDDIDVIYIGLTTHLHFEISLLYINAGKNVLCEKPMASNLEECKKVYAAAKEKNVFYAEGFWSRYFPVYEKLSEMVSNGDIGDLEMINAHFTFSIQGIEVPFSILQGIGCYPVMLTNLFFKGMPEVIEAQGKVSDKGIDTQGVVTLKYPGGRIACISYSCEAAMGASNAVLRGTKGNLQIPDFMWCPNQLVLNNGERVDFPFPEVADVEKPNYPHPQGFTYQIEAVRQFLLKDVKTSDKIPPEDSLTIWAIVEEALKKMGAKSWESPFRNA